MPITKEQAAHLNQRISDAFSANRYRKLDAQPVAVVKAKAVIKSWEDDQAKKTVVHSAKVSAAVRDAREAVLGADWPGALAVVKKLESTKF